MQAFFLLFLPLPAACDSRRETAVSDGKVFRLSQQPHALGEVKEEKKARLRWACCADESTVRDPWIPCLPSRFDLLGSAQQRMAQRLHTGCTVQGKYARLL